MSDDEIYERIGELSDSTDPSERIVGLIIDEMTNRRGLRHEWDNIDPEIQLEIAEAWIEIVRGEIG